MHLVPLQCWATTTPGLEHLAAHELSRLGVTPGESEPGGVGFMATADRLADALLWCSTVNRISVRLAQFTARTFADLEKQAARVEWARVIPPGSGVHFRVTSKKSRLYHNDGIAERLERVAIGAVTGATAVRAPSAAEALEDDLTAVPPVQRIIVRIFRDEVTLSADASGALMHLRGWRQAVAKAPMRETLAASLLAASGWTDARDDGAQFLPLLDPFCGSGTIAIEAARIARRMAPGGQRRFAAEAWPMLSEATFADARERAKAGELGVLASEIVGCDRDAGAIAASMANAERAGVAADIQFVRATISQLPPDERGGFIVTNPPYGARIGERTALRDLYATIGRVVVERRPNWTLAMLSADHMLEAQTRLPLVELARTTNGGLPVRVMASAVVDKLKG